jgi:GMP synthase-like glutamine amidotransferase
MSPIHIGMIAVALVGDRPIEGGRAAASSTEEGCAVSGPLDGDRFGTCDETVWRGRAGEAAWWWEVRFDEPTEVGAILQVVGSDAEEFQDAPRRSVWQATEDGILWTDLVETTNDGSKRLYRLDRLATTRRWRGLRLLIEECDGRAPTLRAVELYARSDAAIEFPEWIAAVSTVEERESRHEAAPFVQLARRCSGWEHTPAQRIWMGDVDLEFATAEPRPLALFLSGNYNDWCQKDRTHWKGLEAILAEATTPMWGSCGGAQGLAILAETGTDAPWDCPRCRDDARPRLPIYTHIGHTGPSPCGVYDRNIAERGPTNLRIVRQDPVLDGLPELFASMESHVGQIDHPPDGWSLLVTAGPGAKTRTQLIKRDGRPIYAAQFHIEMQGTSETSAAIMAGFLAEARRWRSAGSGSGSAGAAGDGRSRGDGRR